MTEEKQPTEMEIKYARALQILNDRNVALETEVGRLTMINLAYEEQFRDMRKVISRLDAELKSLKSTEIIVDTRKNE